MHVSGCHTDSVGWGATRMNTSGFGYFYTSWCGDNVLQLVVCVCGQKRLTLLSFARALVARCSHLIDAFPSEKTADWAIRIAGLHPFYHSSLYIPLYLVSYCAACAVCIIITTDPNKTDKTRFCAILPHFYIFFSLQYICIEGRKNGKR